MSRYAYIVAACDKYVPEINALLNSLDIVHDPEHPIDVHFWHFQFPEEYLEKIKDAFDYNLILHKISYEESREFGGVAEIVCRKRYDFAADIGQDYDAVCVLDADLVFTRNPWQFFHIADRTGFILGTHKEQNKKYDHEHHKYRGEFVIDPTWNNDKDLCNCPLFIDAYKWRDALRLSWTYFVEGFTQKTNFKAPDMDAMNIAFIHEGAYDKIIKLSNHSWLGTNEGHLKPYTRACMKDNGLFTENGQEIFCFHGQYYKKAWRDCQLGNRNNCAKHYLKCNLDDQAKGAMNCLYEIFKKVCFGHKVSIEKKDYVHPELPYQE